MALPTLNTFTPNTTIESGKVNENFTNLRNRTDITSSTDHITLTAGTSKLVRITVLRQDNTTNTYTANSVILTGWGYFRGTGATYASEAVTFGITFSERPVVVGVNSGWKSSDPAHNGDASSILLGSVGATQSSTTGFTATYSQPHTFDSYVRIVHSWIAVGQLN